MQLNERPTFSTAEFFAAPRCLAAVLLVACAVINGDLRAQSPADAPRRFEVASVKPTLSPYEAGRASRSTGDRFRRSALASRRSQAAG
jgi:hypothetical protein